MSRQVTVLLTCVGGALLPETLVLLRQSERFTFRIVGLDASPLAAGRRFVDAFHVVPRGNEADYAEQVLALASTEGAEVVLPWSDEEVLALAPRRKEFTRLGITLACPEADIARCLTDKAATYLRMGAAGLPVPPHRLLEGLDGLDTAASDLGYPNRRVIVKPIRSRGGRGVYILDHTVSQGVSVSPSRILRVKLSAFKQIVQTPAAPNLVMPYFEGAAYDVDALSYDGKPIQLVPRKRLNPDGIPFMGNVIESPPGLLELCARVCAALELAYLCDMDVVYSADDEPMLMEINPRPSGSIAAAMAAGVPIFDSLISLCLTGQADGYPLPCGRVIEPYTRLAVADAPN